MALKDLFSVKYVVYKHTCPDIGVFQHDQVELFDEKDRMKAYELCDRLNKEAGSEIRRAVMLEEVKERLSMYNEGNKWTPKEVIDIIDKIEMKSLKIPFYRIAKFYSIPSKKGSYTIKFVEGNETTEIAVFPFKGEKGSDEQKEALKRAEKFKKMLEEKL
jgi:hypothetical protein